MSRSGADVAPRLGELAELDPFSLEPGIIIGERFCVVGPVRHAPAGWRVSVTDVWRALGDEPHHRLELHHLQLSRRDRARFHRAQRADSAMQPRVFACVDCADGVDIVTEECASAGADLPRDAAPKLVLGLAGLLAALHESHVSGVRFARDQLWETQGTWKLARFSHLGEDRGRAADLADMCAFVRELIGPDAEPLLSPVPVSADELWCRARAFFASESLTSFDVLPREAPFVGRESELERLQTGYRDAVVARSSTTILHGERGVGKSRLLEEFESWARSQTDAIVVRGEFVPSPNRHDTGLGEALGGLAAALRRMDPVTLSSLAPRLRRVIPELGILPRRVPALRDLIEDEPPSEFALGDELLRFTETIAAFLLHAGTGKHPVILLLENVEHADASALGVLRALAAAGPGSHLQVIATARGPAPADLQEAGAQARPLSPLDVGHVQALVTHCLPGPILDAEGIAAELHDSSRGLPLAAWASLQLWVRESALARDAAGIWRRDASKVADAGVDVLVRHRLERLDASATATAVLAAASEGVIEVAWVAQVAERSIDEARDRLDSLLHSGILARASDGYRFWHEEVRRGVLDWASPEEVAAAHAKIARWLRGVPGVSSAPLAYHEERGHLMHESLPAQHLQAARELLDVYESSAAQWHLEHALASPLSPDQRLRALEAAGDAALLSEDAERAARSYVAAIEEADSTLWAIELAARAVRALYARASGDAAIRVGKAALRRVGKRLPAHTPGKLFATLAAFLSIRLPVRAMSPELRSAMCRLYTELSACLLIGDPLNVGVCTLWSYRTAQGIRTGPASLATSFYSALYAMMGQHRRASRLLDVAQVLAEEAGDDWALGTVHHLRGHMVELPTGQYAEGQASLERAVETFRRTGDVSVAAISSYFRAVYGYERESASRILGWLTETEQMAARHGNELVRLETAALRLLVEARRGLADVDVSAAELERRIDQGETVTHDALLASTYTAAALLEAGHASAARSRILVAARLVPALPGMLDVARDYYSVLVSVLLAQPELEAGEMRMARQALRQLARAGKTSPRLHAAFLLGTARLMRRVGKIKQARANVERLRSYAELHGMRHLVAEAHAELCRLLSASDVLAAAEHARQAAAITARLGYRVPALGPASTSNDALGAAARLEEMTPVGSAVGQVETLDTPALRAALSEVEANMTASLPGVPVRFELDEGASVRCSAPSLQSVLVNLMLAARDAVSRLDRMQVHVFGDVVGQSRASGLAGARAGSFVVAQVRAWAKQGPAIGNFGGLRGCRLAVTKLGGFLVVEPLATGGVVFSAYLPGAEHDHAPSTTTPSRTAVVLHPDALTRRTIIAALAQMGFECQDAGIAAEFAPGTLVFGDGATLSALDIGGHVRAIEVVRPGQAGRTQFTTLPVPFAVGDLEELVG